MNKFIRKYLSLSSLVKLWQPNKTSLYNKKKLCEEKACTKIKKSFQNVFVYVHSPKRWAIDSSSASQKEHKESISGEKKSYKA